MTTNSIAISRNLVAAGLELTAANAIAEEMVTNVDDTLATKEGLVKVETTTKENLVKVETEIKSLATKADLAKIAAATKVDLKDMESRLESKMGKMDTKIEVIETKINVVIALMIGLFIVFIADILMR